MTTSRTTSRIDLSRLKAPDVIEELDFEQILEETKSLLNNEIPLVFDQDGKPQIIDAELVTLNNGSTVWQIPQSEYANLLYLHLESDTTTRLLNIFAYREMMLRARINDASRSVMLHYATAADLDNLAVFHKLERLIITPEDLDTEPATAAVMEGDEDFRRRILLAPDKYTTAGSEESYLFHALSASGSVKDASYNSPEPIESDITILSHEGTGTADTTLINTVKAALNGEYVRPNSEVVRVLSAEIISYQVTASIKFYPGIDSSIVLSESKNALLDYTTENHKLGRNITESGLHAALHQEGVMSVTITQPAVLPIAINENQAAFCNGTNVTDGGIDE